MKDEILSDLSPDQKPRLDVEDEAEFFCERAQKSLADFANADNARSVMPLFNGPEGGPITERTIAKIFQSIRVPDLRESAVASGSTDDTGVEAVYETNMPNGVRLRLTRLHYEGGERWLELDALRS